MPELPEVETVARGLAQKMVGHTITAVDVRRPDLREPFPTNLAEVLTGATVTNVTRRSKFALIGLDNGYTVLIHLGMSGRIVFMDPQTPPAKHDHLRIMLGHNLDLRLNDPRRFGVVDMFLTAQMAENKWLATLGPEPLTDAFNPAMLKAALKTRSQAIKPTIMDSKLVVGVGNIYACEALFRAGINPARKASSLTLAACARLTDAIKTVLTEAIAAGGTSLRDYVQTDGTLGYFQHQFRVYGRAGEGCLVCGTPIKKITQAQRSTFYCPACQR